MADADDPLQRTQRMLDRLMLAGWLRDSAHIENPQGLGPGSSEFAFTWTAYGLERLRQFLALATEIEECSGPMKDEDWQRLKMIAVTAHNQASGDERPPK
jgi:hypothetical protein